VLFFRNPSRVTLHVSRFAERHFWSSCLAFSRCSRQAGQWSTSLRRIVAQDRRDELIGSIWSVWFIWLVSFNQTDQINKRDQPAPAYLALYASWLADAGGLF